MAQQNPTSSPNDTVIQLGSTATLVDTQGNIWSLSNTSGGQVAVNGVPDPSTDHVTSLALVNGVIWANEASLGLWWSETAPSAGWQPPGGTPVSPLTAPTASAPASTQAPSSTTTAISPSAANQAASGTRDPSQTPFSSTSVFNMPLGLGAQWQANAQLAGAGIVVDTVGNWNQNIYSSSASDPLVTVTVAGSSGGPAGTYQVHIPVGAQPSGPSLSAGGDDPISIDDTSTHTWYSFGEFTWTSATTATAGQGSAEADNGSGIQFDNGNWDQGVGTLRESDLQAGTINHMLRIELPTSMLLSVSSSPNQLASYAWPQTQEDGNGPSAYTGTVPFGVTVGIPATAVEPAAIKANAGANMLWQALQDHGAMIRDSSGAPNTVVVQADQNVSANDPLILGMEQFGSQIMSQVQILTNQGPSSVNGGGTPIVPLDAPLSDAAGAISSPSGTPTPAPTPAPTPTPTPSPTPPPSGSNYITPGSGSFQDAAGNTYTIDSAQNADENGKPIAGGAGTGAMEYANNSVYGQDASSGQWYVWNQQNWTASSAPIASSPSPAPAPTPTPTPTPAPSMTDYITPGSGSFKDAAGNVYSIDAAGNATENTQPIPGGGGTAAMDLSGNTVYGQDTTTKQWYSWNQQNWSPATVPNNLPAATASGGAIASATTAATTPLPTITVQGASQAPVTIDANVAQNQTLIGDTFDLTAPGMAKVVFGSADQTVTFSGMTNVTLSGGTGSATVIADGGTNSFDVSSGALKVTGGAGADSYLFHQGSGSLTVTDFAASKGDTLTLDTSLRSSLQETADGHGGVMLSFGSGTGSVDLANVASIPVSSLHFA